MENKKKCLIIDGNNLIHRSYHASQKLQWMGENKETYMFLKMFINIIRRESYTKIFITFDKGKKTFRNEMEEEYKANRKKTPYELIKNIKDVKKLIKDIDLKYISKEGFEADDLIASFIKKFKDEKDYEFNILSQDKDLFQLLSENVKILRYKKGSLEKFGPDEFFSENGFIHNKFLYYLSLKGDKADNIKGIEGIGEVRAKYIVSNFENIEQTFQNLERIPKEIRILIEKKRKNIENNTKIISLVENISLDDWKSYDFSWKKIIDDEKLLNFCKKKGINSIIRFLIGTQNRTRTDTE